MIHTCTCARVRVRAFAPVDEFAECLKVVLLTRLKQMFSLSSYCSCARGARKSRRILASLNSGELQGEPAETTRGRNTEVCCFKCKRLKCSVILYVFYNKKRTSDGKANSR